MRRIGCGLFLTIMLVLATTPVGAGDALFQYSTIDALLAGLYDGTMSIKDLKYQGDFGLGTLNGLDGELVVLEGQAYHVTAGGMAQVPDDEDNIPFAAVTFFDPESSHALAPIPSLTALNAAVARSLPSDNLFYAIRIDAAFTSVAARAIPKQTPPYPTLAEAAKEQQIVTFSGRGTLVGLWSPAYVKGIGVPGFHWHFITADRTGGGHVLDCALPASQANIDILRQFSLSLPEGKAFDQVDLTPDRGTELRQVEHKQ